MPLLKAYGSDQAFRVCETAVQVLGGAGYISDYGIEQYLRDAKIFSIYEGTNHIQAMDLVSRKLSQRDGADMKKLLTDIGAFMAAHAEHPRARRRRWRCCARRTKPSVPSTMRLAKWAQAGKLELVALNANRFLEMMSEMAVGWLLLEAAVVAHDAIGSRPAWRNGSGLLPGARSPQPSTSPETCCPARARRPRSWLRATTRR